MHKDHINKTIVQQIIERDSVINSRKTQEVDYKVEQLGGLSNFIYKITIECQTQNPKLLENNKNNNQNSQNKESQFVYKKYSNFFDCLVNRQRENIICEQLYRLNIGPQVIYCDEQQRVETFLDLETLPVSKMSNNLLYFTKIATILGKFHKCFSYQQENQIVLEKLNDKTNNNNKNIYNNFLIHKIFNKEVEEAIFQNIDNTQLLNEEQKIEISMIFKELFEKNQFQKLLKNFILPLTSQKVVFAHNDLNSTNFLYKNDDFNTQQLIDYEYAGFNYRAHEFGNFFNELTWDYEVKEFPYFEINESQCPSTQKQKLFFIFYILQNEDLISELNQSRQYMEKVLTNLQNLSDANSNDKKNIGQSQEEQYIQRIYNNIIENIIPQNQREKIEKEIDDLIRDSMVGRLFSHLFWLFIGTLSLSYTDISLDLHLYIKVRYQEINKLIKEFQKLPNKI